MRILTILLLLAAAVLAGEEQLAEDVAEFTERKPGVLRGVGDKPFLAELWNTVHVGGYVELEYHSSEDGPLGFADGFRLHRLNLFLYGDVTDRVTVSAEVEIENEADEVVIATELAVIDWTFAEELVFRGGVVLVPVGRVNVNHDGPVRELSDRPMVSRFVIPTTWSEAGAGFFGRIGLGSSSAFSYEGYLVNGSALLNADGELSDDRPGRILRAGRGSLGADNNSAVAFTGRLALDLPLLGGQLSSGIGAHVGAYDELKDNTLGVYAIDWAWVRPCESLGVELVLEGEVAYADIERNGFARMSGVPADYRGYYLQMAVKTTPAWFQRFAEEGSFTYVVRVDFVDLAGDRGGAIEPGIAIRPTPDTVLKLSVRFHNGRLAGSGRDDVFIFGFTTYF